jgi:uncharacterized OB-fold protein
MSDATISYTAYNQFLNQHKLMGARCQDCSTLYLPPRPLCPNCHSENLSWEPLSGSGTLVAFTTVHIGPTAMLEAGYGRDNPYCAGIVRLADGPSISAQILGVDAAHPEGIKIGTPLKAAFIERGEGDAQHSVLIFELVNGQ